MQSDTNSDFLLWKRFLEGDLDAYTQIYNQTAKDLFRFGLLYTSDRELIKDCIHDVFVKIYTSRSRLTSIDNITAYLTIALKNTLLNALKKNSSHFSLEEINVEEKHSQNPSTPETSYIDKEYEISTKEKVTSMMSQLTERQREIIYYRYLKDMSIQEISQITEMNSQSVSNSIQRALSRIRDLFKRK